MLSDPVGYRAKLAAERRAERVRDPDRVRERERRNGRIKRQRYPEKKCAEVRKRQAAKQQRLPAWADLEAIKRFYENRPDGTQVDHKIPLRGRTVSGLHVVENLQYLTPEENLLKNNNFETFFFRDHPEYIPDITALRF